MFKLIIKNTHSGCHGKLKITGHHVLGDLERKVFLKVTPAAQSRFLGIKASWGNDQSLPKTPGRSTLQRRIKVSHFCMLSPASSGSGGFIGSTG